MAARKTDESLGSPLRVISPSEIQAAFPEDIDKFIADDLNSVSLAVVQIPLVELSGFLKTVHRWKLTDLSTRQLYNLTERLLSLLEFDFTPTASLILPIRVDVLLKRILSQPVLFLPSFLQQVTEWFGFMPDTRIRQAWIDLAQGQPDVDTLPEPLTDWLECDLAVVVGNEVFVPLALLRAIHLHSRQPGWASLPSLLHQLRHTLLEGNYTDPAGQAYQQLTSSLRTPHPSLDGHKYRTTRTRGMLVDLLRYDWSIDAPDPVIDAVLVALQALFDSDPARYRNVFNRVHGPVWDVVGQSVNSLKKIESSIPDARTTVDPSNYVDSSRLVSRRLKLISEAYTVLTELEVALGVDRYLGGQALSKDLSLVHDFVRKIGERIHQGLDTPRRVYLRQWNLSCIASVIFRLLDLPGADGPLVDYFPHDQRRVIFLLIDAFGYTQFQWFLSTVSRRTSAPLANNIFAWLREQSAFSDSYMLASNLVSITGACLPTIYTGKLPRQTGVIGSHMMMEGHHLNVLYGADKRNRLEGSEVEEVYRRNVNSALTPFAEIAARSDVDVRVFHGGNMGFRPLAEFSYGSLLSQKRVTRVRKADRIFTEALPTVIDWARGSDEKHLALIYYPLIDQSGHGSGPYTQFQMAELNKLNFVFTHFLVDLARQAERLFDGQTSVVVTADHGMFESATTSISHRTVRNVLGGKAACRGMTFVYGNRAMHIYGVEDMDLETTREKLVKYFDNTKIPVSVLTRNDPLVVDLLCDSGSDWADNCPGLILQFYGQGVFYYKDKLPSHRFLYGAHGGVSVEEIFVPLIHFTLTPSLAARLKEFF